MNNAQEKFSIAEIVSIDGTVNRGDRVIFYGTSGSYRVCGPVEETQTG